MVPAHRALVELNKLCKKLRVGSRIVLQIFFKKICVLLSLEIRNNLWAHWMFFIGRLFLKLFGTSLPMKKYVNVREGLRKPFNLKFPLGGEAEGMQIEPRRIAECVRDFSMKRAVASKSFLNGTLKITQAICTSADGWQGIVPYAEFGSDGVANFSDDEVWDFLGLLAQEIGNRFDVEEISASFGTRVVVFGENPETK